MTYRAIAGRGDPIRYPDGISALLRYYAASSDNRLPRLGTTYSSEIKRNSWSFKIGPICCPETSVKDYHSTLRNIAERFRTHQHCGLCVSLQTYAVPTTGCFMWIPLCGTATSSELYFLLGSIKFPFSNWSHSHNWEYISALIKQKNASVFLCTVFRATLILADPDDVRITLNLHLQVVYWLLGTQLTA
jgi:hypothetical protein